MRRFPLVLALIAATAASAAAAQTAGGGGSAGGGSGGGGGSSGAQPSVSSGRGPSRFPDGMDAIYRIQAEMFRQKLTRIAQDADQRVLVHRAMRVGDVVRKGDCAGAEALARAEGDAPMAARVVQFCEPGKGWNRQARQALRARG